MNKFSIQQGSQQSAGKGLGLLFNDSRKSDIGYFCPLHRRLQNIPYYRDNICYYHVTRSQPKEFIEDHSLPQRSLTSFKTQKLEKMTLANLENSAKSKKQEEEVTNLINSIRSKIQEVKEKNKEINENLEKVVSNNEKLRCSLLKGMPPEEIRSYKAKIYDLRPKIEKLNMKEKFGDCLLGYIPSPNLTNKQIQEIVNIYSNMCEATNYLINEVTYMNDIIKTFEGIESKV